MRRFSFILELILLLFATGFFPVTAAEELGKNLIASPSAINNLMPLNRLPRPALNLQITPKFAVWKITPILSLRLTLGEKSYLYADTFAVILTSGQKNDGGNPAAVTLSLYNADNNPATKKVGEERPVYINGTELDYRLPDEARFPLKFTVEYQGCSEQMCFMPTTQDFTLADEETAARNNHKIAEFLGNDVEITLPAENAENSDAIAFKHLAAQFTEITQIGGFVEPANFIDWLTAKKEIQGVSRILDDILEEYGLLAVALLIIPLGFMLNLTPCVLPIIPINLAIIGAAQVNVSQKNRAGLWLGLLYGGGIAIVYGVLGLVVVLTGSRFGALNSLPSFNFIIAAVFVGLALAMFDVWHLDFSSLNKTQINHRENPYIGAFLLGGLTALLAGACVAPVLIWVLVLATDLYAKQNFVGLLLPFLLGVGMALPWPLLAAGVSRLPKPGKWMVRVKQVFGVLILIVAVNYLYTGWNLLREKRNPEATEEKIALAGWEHNLLDAMQIARRERKPLLINFSGLACASCAAMKRSTLIAPEVTDILQNYVKVEFLTDDLSDPLVKAAQAEYGIVGIPTYVILQPHP